MVPIRTQVSYAVLAMYMYVFLIKLSFVLLCICGLSQVALHYFGVKLISLYLEPQIRLSTKKEKCKKRNSID